MSTYNDGGYARILQSVPYEDASGWYLRVKNDGATTFGAFGWATCATVAP